MKIAVAGTGYVGLSMAVLLAQHNEVIAVDIDPKRIEMVNMRQSPIQDDYIEEFLATRPLKLKATLDAEEGYGCADFVVIATPTNYDSARNFFNTSTVEEVIKLVAKSNPLATIVIKSTVPVGYTEAIRQELGIENIFFAPEFLRESKALFDNLYPSRIVVGFDHSSELLRKKSPPICSTHL